jgi:hypothetical protein
MRQWSRCARNILRCSSTGSLVVSTWWTAWSLTATSLSDGTPAMKAIATPIRGRGRTIRPRASLSRQELANAGAGHHGAGSNNFAGLPPCIGSAKATCLQSRQGFIAQILSICPGLTVLRR